MVLILCKLLDLLKREFESEVDFSMIQKRQSSIPEKDKVKTFEALIPIIVAELAALKAERTGQPVQSEIMKLYKAAEDTLAD